MHSLQTYTYVYNHAQALDFGYNGVEEDEE